MSDADVKLHARILNVLGKDSLTAKQIAQKLGYPNEMGIVSCLRGMRARSLVRRGKPDLSEAYSTITWRAP